jgi:hypothetical protein
MKKNTLVMQYSHPSLFMGSHISVSQIHGVAPRIKKKSLFKELQERKESASHHIVSAKKRNSDQ